MSGSGPLRVRLCQSTPVPLDVAFDVEPDQVLAVFGASGSGKTTMLRAIAGLHTADEALVQVGDTTWADSAHRVQVPTHARRVGLVFQHYALFPHLNAVQNVEAALSHVPDTDRRARAQALLQRVHLHGRDGHYPRTLSGGERQRVAVARALARDPEVLLLDEPFSAVDRPTRRQLRDEVDAIRRTLRVPTVLVTHDVEDVTRLATHVLILEQGRSVAQGPLVSLLARPDLREIRDALGLGSLVVGTVSAVESERGLATIAFDGGTLVAPNTGLQVGTPVRVRVPAREVILSDRVPEGLSLHNAVHGTVTALSSEIDSPFVVVQVTVGSTALLAEVTRDAVHRLRIETGVSIYALVKSVSLEL